MPGSFPKVPAIGARNNSHLFDGVVEITEKVDGSQFNFGKDIEGKLWLRSKGAAIDPDNPPKMFQRGVEYVLSIADRLENGWDYHGEYLEKPKHNTLVYERIPANHIALYAVDSLQGYLDWGSVALIAKQLSVDSVPLLASGHGANFALENLKALLEIYSFLGGARIEGFVVKNPEKPMEDYPQHHVPFTLGKYVSEAFKEVHGKTWALENTSKGKFEVMLDNFRSEARWRKAVQRRLENGDLERSSKDIGPLVKAIQNDLVAEEKENLKGQLWSIFKDEITRSAVKGFPNWYKEQLLASATEDLRGDGPDAQLQ